MFDDAVDFVIIIRQSMTFTFSARSIHKFPTFLTVLLEIPVTEQIFLFRTN